MGPEANLSPSPHEAAPAVENSANHQAETQQFTSSPFETGERFEQRSETPTGDQSAPPLPVVTPVSQVAPATPVDPTPVAASASDHPAVAKDSDLIEREWVQKAKQILGETKDDPHSRSERVQALQVDYLAKRYNRKLGDGN